MTAQPSSSSILSVVTPITKMAGKLQKLESWVGKAVDLDIQVILVHDFQEQETQDQLNQMVQQFASEKLILIQGKYGSAGIARNAGIQVAQGTWIAFWDSDDLPELEIVIQTISTDLQRDYDCAVFSFFAINELSASKKWRRLGNDPLLEVALTPGIWRFLFRKVSLSGIHFHNYRIGEDQSFLGLYNLSARKVFFKDIPIYNYFFGGQNHQTKNRAARIDMVQVLKFTSKEIRNSAKNSRFLELQFARQSLTCFKMFNLRISWHTTVQMVKLLISVDSDMRWRIFNAFKQIILMDRKVL